MLNNPIICCTNTESVLILLCISSEFILPRSDTKSLWIPSTSGNPDLISDPKANTGLAVKAIKTSNGAALNSTIAMMPNATRLFVFNQEQSRPPDPQKIKNLIQRVKVRPDIVQFYKKFMPDCVAAWEYQ